MYAPPREQQELYDGPKHEHVSDKSGLLEGPARPRSLSQARGNVGYNKALKPPPQERTVYIMRLGLRLISLLMSIIILGLLGHTLATYQQTKNWRTMNTKTKVTSRIWPLSFTMHPSYLMFAAAAVATLFSFILALASCSKAVRRLTTLGNVLTLIVSGIAISLWIGAAVYFKVWDTGKKFKYDLWSWVCSHSQDEYNNFKYGPLCTQMRFAWWAAVTVAGVELFGIVTVVWGMFQMRKRKYERIGGR